ncbi:hypothetical protein [Sphingomonas sp.]|uniref:hypothetical protein n=1 Tax=Sphingomonas sp. TaxID=28214 RepID=UPI0031E0998C
MPRRFPHPAVVGSVGRRPPSGEGADAGWGRRSSGHVALRLFHHVEQRGIAEQSYHPPQGRAVLRITAQPVGQRDALIGGEGVEPVGPVGGLLHPGQGGGISHA